MNIFVLLCFTYCFTVSKQQEFANNGTQEMDILGALQVISKDTGIVLLTQSDPFGSNASILHTDDESDFEELKLDTDDDFAEIDEENVHPVKKYEKMKNILRWMPTKKRYKTNYVEKQEALFEQKREGRNALRARELNAERIDYVMSLLKDNFWVTVYMYGEIRRILSTRVVVDDIREMIMFLEKRGNEKLKQAVLKCYNDEKEVFQDNTWRQKTNNLVVQVLKDPINDNVVA